MSSHGDRATCARCGVGIEYVEYDCWNGTEKVVLDAWWAHDVHPDDEHEARPAP
jgi:hypothetical protein